MTVYSPFFATQRNVVFDHDYSTTPSATVEAVMATMPPSLTRTISTARPKPKMGGRLKVPTLNIEISNANYQWFSVSLLGYTQSQFELAGYGSNDTNASIISRAVESTISDDQCITLAGTGELLMKHIRACPRGEWPKRLWSFRPCWRLPKRALLAPLAFPNPPPTAATAMTPATTSPPYDDDTITNSTTTTSGDDNGTLVMELNYERISTEAAATHCNMEGDGISLFSPPFHLSPST
jgi:hypothetical protein